MLKSFIRKIRTKPKHVRDQYALGIAGTFTTLVALLWLFGAPGTSLDDDLITNSYEVDEKKPFGDFLDYAKDQIASVKESVPDIEEIENATSGFDDGEEFLQNMVDESLAGFEIGYDEENVLATSSIFSAATSSVGNNGNTVQSKKTESIRIITTTATNSSSTASVQ